MSGHTPGPWSISDSSWVTNHRDIDAPTHGALAVVVWRMEEEERSPECEANAALIAAAPDLLEALEMIVTEADSYTARTGKPVYNWLDSARAAIAKARGES